MPSLQTVVVCECANAGLLNPRAVRLVSDGLKAEGVQLHTVADLCELTARRDSLLGRLAAEGSLTVMACYPRAVKWLFSAAGAPLPPDARLVNLRRELPDSAITAALGGSPSDKVLLAGAGAASSPEALSPRIHGDETVPTLGSAVLTESVPGRLPPPKEYGWIPWFPVIDFDRCNHCLQCLSFCLFGVYGVGVDRRVTVRAPENCKANCPACARVCPEQAIVFPKHKAAPINGDEVSDAACREAVKVDISALLGGDVYSRLRSRGESRFSKDHDHEHALRERQRFLARLAETGDIPPELLLSLGKMSPPASFSENAASASARADESVPVNPPIAPRSRGPQDSRE